MKHKICQITCKWRRCRKNLCIQNVLKYAFYFHSQFKEMKKFLQCITDQIQTRKVIGIIIYTLSENVKGHVAVAILRGSDGVVAQTPDLFGFVQTALTLSHLKPVKPPHHNLSEAVINFHLLQRKSLMFTTKGAN